MKGLALTRGHRIWATQPGQKVIRRANFPATAMPNGRSAVALLNLSFWLEDVTDVLAATGQRYGSEERGECPRVEASGAPLRVA
ncbi:unnamed protein product [Gadus morhua 'NCC']